MQNQILDAAEELIKTIWHLRRTASLESARKHIDELDRLFVHLRDGSPPTLQENFRYLILSAQFLRLKAVLDIELQRYQEAREKFQQMHAIGEQIHHPATIAMALAAVGAESQRLGEIDAAIDYLEQARDTSFMASKHVMTFCNSYLARAYASNHQKREFHRTIETALTIARAIKPYYGDGTDFVFHRLSGVLAEKSWGLAELGEAQACLDMAGEIQQQITAEGNQWLEAWIPWDWARAHLALGNIQACTEAAMAFYNKAKALRSPHALSSAVGLLGSIKEAGYGDRPEVQPFRALVTER